MPPKSDVWRHFDRDSKKCRLCGAQVATKSNTTNLWQHLGVRHSIYREPAKKGSQAEPDSSIDDPGSTQDAPVRANQSEKGPSPSVLSRRRPLPPEESSVGGASTSKVQRTILRGFDNQTSFSRGGEKDKVLEDAALYMVVKDRLPLRATEKNGFLRFAKKAVPLWSPPNRHRMTKLMEEKYEKAHTVVEGAMSQLPSVCLAADCWTDPHTTKGYLGVTTHFLIGTEMESAALGLVHLTEPHEAEYLAKKLEEILIEWDLKKENVTFCVTDNAGNIGNAVKLVFGPNRHLNCFDHTLNLIPKSTLGTHKVTTEEDGVKKTAEFENVPGFPDLVKKMKKVVTYSHTSTNFADELRRIQIQDLKKTEGTVLRLIQDVETRWDSTYLMAERYLEMSTVIASAGTKFPKVNSLTGAELAEVQVAVRLLSHFHVATVEMSGEKLVTGSKAIPVAAQLKKALTKEAVPESCAIAGRLKTFLLAELKRRFGALEDVLPLAAATILDPRFKRLRFSSILSASKAVTFLTKEFNRLVEKENLARSELAAAAATPAETPADTPVLDQQSRAANSFWEDHDAEVAALNTTAEVQPDYAGGLPVEFRHYLNSKVAARDANPFEVWERMKNEHPTVYALARRWLPTVGSSSPVERLFSDVGLTATDLRNRLTPTHLSQLAFLASVSDNVWDHCPDPKK